MFTQLENGAGLDFVIWLQSMRAAPLDYLALVLDFLGNDLFFVLIVLLFYWSVNRHLGRRALVVLIFVELLVTALKLIFQTPRPFMVAPDQVQLLVEPGSFGIPSGHVAISLAILGYAVLWLKIRWGWWWLAAYTVVMAWSRMYTGAHYPQDVISGAAAGLAVVWFSWRFMDTFARLWGSQLWQVKMVVVVAAALIVSFAFFAGEEQQMILGIMLGGGISLVLEERYLRFEAGSGSLLNRIIRLVVGLVLLGIAYYGLKMVFDGLEPQMIFRTIRYALVGALAMGIYPWLCVRAGFMQQEKAVTTD